MILNIGEHNNMYEKLNDLKDENPTKRKIEESFLKLYKENKIEKISIRQITEDAQIYRGTFYYYFEDIYDLLNKIENEFLEKTKVFLQITIDVIFSNEIEKYAPIIDKFFLRNKEIINLFLLEKPNALLMRQLKETAKSLAMAKLNLSKENLSTTQQYVMEYIANAALGSWIMWIEDQDDFKSSDLIKLIREINLKFALDYFKK